MMNVWLSTRAPQSDRIAGLETSALIVCPSAFVAGLSGAHIALMQAMYAAALKTAEDRVARERAVTLAAGLN